MLTVTDAAGAHLTEMLKQSKTPGNMAVRFVDDGQGLVLQPDTKREGDTTFDHDGRTILVLDAKMSELLAEDTLDLEGSKLTLQRPEEAE